MNKTTGLLLLTLAFLPGMAAADPCDKDRTLVCGDVTAGDRQVYDCMMGRKDKLTPACSKAMDRATELFQAAVTACKPEVQRWCAQYTGDRRVDVIDCLRRHKDVVGDNCRSKVRQFRAYDFDLQS